MTVFSKALVVFCFFKAGGTDANTGNSRVDAFLKSGTYQPPNPKDSKLLTFEIDKKSGGKYRCDLHSIGAERFKGDKYEVLLIIDPTEKVIDVAILYVADKKPTVDGWKILNFVKEMVDAKKGWKAILDDASNLTEIYALTFGMTYYRKQGFEFANDVAEMTALEEKFKNIKEMPLSILHKEKFFECVGKPFQSEGECPLVMRKFKEMYQKYDLFGKDQIHELFDVTKISLDTCVAIGDEILKDFKRGIPKKVYKCAVDEANWDQKAIFKEKEFTESMKSLKAYVQKFNNYEVGIMVYTSKKT